MSLLPAHRSHPRTFAQFRYVYPVVSRRSRGISIGLNTNPNKACNFDCIYCQVDRSVASAVRCFDLAGAAAELRELVDIVQSGRVAQYPDFAKVPARLLRLNDIALSGDLGGFPREGDSSACSSRTLLERSTTRDRCPVQEDEGRDFG